MKKILLILFIMMVPSVVSLESFQTQINITTNGSHITIYGEEGSKFQTETSSSTSNTMTIFIYRNSSFEEDLDDLRDSYNNLSKNYKTSLDAIKSLNETVDRNATDFFKDYTACYFSLIETNQTKNTCTTKRDEYLAQKEECVSERDTCENQRQSYQNQYATCNEDKVTCEEEIKANSFNWFWFGLMGVAIGLGGAYFYLTKKNPLIKEQHPVDNTEEMEL